MDKEKSIAEEIKEQQLEITININTGQWHSSKPLNDIMLRRYLMDFCDNLFMGFILKTADQSYMRKMGVKKGN